MHECPKAVCCDSIANNLALSLNSLRSLLYIYCFLVSLLFYFIYTIYSKLALLYENILCLVPRNSFEFSSSSFLLLLLLFLLKFWMVYIYVTYSVHFLYHFPVIKGFSERFDNHRENGFFSWQIQARTESYFGKWFYLPFDGLRISNRYCFNIKCQTEFDQFSNISSSLDRYLEKQNLTQQWVSQLESHQLYIQLKKNSFLWQNSFDFHQLCSI